MGDYESAPEMIETEHVRLIATEIARGILAGLPAKSEDDKALPASMRVAHSLFSELRFALGSSDTVNGGAHQLLPLAVTGADTKHNGYLTYKREKLRGLGAKSLTIAYRTGVPQIANVPCEGEEDVTIQLDRADAVAVALWDGENATGAAFLVTLLTYQ